MSEPAAISEQSFRALTMIQRRLLGVLIEKQKTTPDVYPMSLNALVTGCNQKSNRDPVMNVSDVEVEDNLLEMQKQALVTRVESGRVEKWRHLLYEQWHVGRTEIAGLAELLLRGPQTEGDLRARISRMEPVDDLDALRALLKPMAQRGLVVYLTPEGRRGTLLTHGFHNRSDLEGLKARHSGVGEIVDAPASTSSPRTAAEITGSISLRLQQLEARQSEMQHELQELRSDMAKISLEFQEFQEYLRAKQ